MSATVMALPAPRRPMSEVERLLLGGLLQGDLKRADFDALGLAELDFSTPVFAHAFRIVRKLLEHGHQVSPQTVFAIGAKGRVFSDADSEMLLVASAESSVTLETLRQLAGTLRTTARGAMLATWHEAQARELRAGRFDVARAAAELEVEREKLLAEFAPDDTAASDFDETMWRWDKHEAEGTHRLMPTGLQVLDSVIGGFPPTLSILLGAPGAGKTAVIASMIRAMLERDENLRIGLFGLEDGSAWLVRRWLATEMGIGVRDVGAAKRTEEQHARYNDAGPRLRALGERVICYRRAGASVDQIVRRASAWRLRDGVGCIFIDNLTEVALRDSRGQQQQFFEGTSEALLRLRTLGEQRELPVVVAAHTTKEGSQSNGPPDPSEVRGGQNAAQRARLILGLWRKWDALRCTVLKANETESGTTVEFERLKEAALVRADGGAIIDLADEKAKERKQRREKEDRDNVERALIRKRLRVEREGKPEEKPKEEAPTQGELLGGGA